MKTKGQGLERVMNIMMYFLIGLIILLVVIMMISNFVAIDEHKKICKDLDMEVLSESFGSLFTEEQLACWNPETKEVKKVL